MEIQRSQLEPPLNGESFLVIPKGYLMGITIKKTEGYPAETLRVFLFGSCSLVNHDGQLRLRLKNKITCVI